MTQMSTWIGINIAECAVNASQLPEFATEPLDFGQIWTWIIAEMKKKPDFLGGIYGCAVAEFWTIRFICLYSALYSDGDSDGFWELFWADSALFMLFWSIWLDDSGRSSPYDTNKPKTA